MQVLVPDAELRQMQQVAAAKGMTLAEWVRQTLRVEAAREPAGDPRKKLALIRAAARNQFPAPDIEQMLAEIAHGYDAVDGT